MFVGSDITAIVTKDDIISLQAFNILSDEYEETGKTAAVKCTKEQALEMADKYFKVSLPGYDYDLISRLGPLDKAIITLWLDEKSYDEMAAIMGMTSGNIAIRLHRIKDKLSKMAAS